MKKRLFLAVLMMGAMTSFAQQKDYAIKSVDFTKVQLNDKFWLPRIETNRTVTIPASFARCQSTNRIQNFVNAANKTGKFLTTFPFDDTDIYKTIEGASFSLAVHPDAKLDKFVDSLVTIVAAAQEPDGYLYTARTINPAAPHSWSGKNRWEKERELSHELYNSGHLYEAASAHYLATKKKNFLNIALKNADLVCSVFGPGKLAVAPGHEIVEMGLVKLYRITGKKEYLATAKFFIDQRGHYDKYNKASKDEWKNGQYWQDDKPVTEQDEAEGHAVRAGYLYSAMADVAALTHDEALIKAVDRIWDNMVSKKMYVQGSVGAIGSGERYGDNYQLPNATAYNETCAAVANVYWNQRMFMLHGNSKYIDVLEKVLYNGLISGEGLDGKSFFYTNAMQITNGVTAGAFNSFNTKGIETTRSGWFECSCCPTNLVRLVPSIPGYIYAEKGNSLYVNLFISGNANLTVANKAVEVIQQNNYPWDGGLKFNINPKTSTTFDLLIRIPGWVRGEAIPSDLYNFEDKSAAAVTIKVNGKAITYKTQNGYALISRNWKKGDVVDVELPMAVKRVTANVNLKEDQQKIALQRGPLMYCAEWPDNNGHTSNITIGNDIQFVPQYKPELLNGVTILKSTNENKTIVAIPYYAWANRGAGEMQVWFPVK
ncbi:glycoside hydrolase family 127 protein [Mucilaginibacter sp. HMF5004]|uniref:glycoside hydrolase family 127 protein n=1 Tax=Mucilaginibacter rivuli TaxID=2857527 RepID=UPI001C6032A8|nr:glycoside hydrolase family 127 protein [Mucilaginibacter rivuli]MBW4888172.1 glycoside hydrolase family 127 protein [Mucilaginibacter rivuli]